MDHFHLFTSLRYDPALKRAPSQGYTPTGWNQNPSGLYLLDFHRDRMLRAATHWRWEAAAQTLDGEQGLERLNEYLQNALSTVGESPQRIKLLLTRDGTLRHEISPTGPRPLSNLLPAYLPAPHQPSLQQEPSLERMPSKDDAFELVVDTQSTAKSEFTHFKTTHRAMYDAARKRANLSLADMKEVLLVNSTDGSIMEGSISTPYFWRGGRWVTPPIPNTYSPSEGSGGNQGTTRRWALERGIVTEQVVPADSLVDGEECWLSTGVRGFVFGRIKL
ncbi:aminotransferase [Xylariomycetidae sp. FL2044]|nr:aminotransferase [Xylariomycetidae sp. FL2044]